MRATSGNDGESLTLNFSRQEMVILNNALNEILNGPDAIPESEFHTRVGVQRSEAVELFREIHEALA